MSQGLETSAKQRGQETRYHGAMNSDPLQITSFETERLRLFLASPQRPANTFSYAQLCGYLFAVCSAPEMIPPSEWLPHVFGGQPAGYQDEQEAQEIQLSLMALYNQINEGVQKREPTLPLGCEASRVVLANLDEQASFAQWSRGFGMGHEWLSMLWDRYTPKDLQEDLGSCLLVLTFFGSRELAEAYREELRGDVSLEQMATDMLQFFPEALLQYSLIGRSIAEVLQRKAQPAQSHKVGRNDPCPCGSGKKYKNCCGNALH